jgi:hypothetical protein
MPGPRTWVFDFLVWFGWLGLFALAQRRFCRKYPGMRSMCMVLFQATVPFAFLPGLWLLMARPADAPNTLAILNQCFGLGVYAQTFLRSVLMLRWIAWTAICGGTAVRNEQMLLTSLVMLTHAAGGSGELVAEPLAKPSSADYRSAN